MNNEHLPKDKFEKRQKMCPSKGNKKIAKSTVKKNATAKKTRSESKPHFWAATVRLAQSKFGLAKFRPFNCKVFFPSNP